MKHLVFATSCIAVLAAAGCASPAPTESRSRAADDGARAEASGSFVPFAALAAAMTPPPATSAGDKSALPAAVAAAPVAPQGEKWQFSVTPYMWAASTNIGMGVEGRYTTGTLTFSDVMNNLDMAGMLHVEANRGKWSIFAEGLYLDMSDTFNGPRGNLDVDITLKETIALGAVAYQFLQTKVLEESSPGANDASVLSLEAYGGVRYVDVTGKINPKAGASARDSVTWWDPVLGMRARLAFTPIVSLVVRGDVGGFSGQDDSSWSFISMLEFKFSPCFSLGAGYGVMTLRYLDGSSSDDLYLKEKLHGPILSATFLF